MKLQYQRNATARMFESPFLEMSSKVHPATPFVVYIPLVAFLLFHGFHAHLTTWKATAVFLPLGWVTWQWMEYAIHRGFFHWEGNGPFTRRLHQIAHGHHHQFPDDHHRLVMPLGASIPLALLIGGGLYLLGQHGVTLPFFSGIVCGYMWYDFVHWSTHARTPLTSWGKAIRSHHMAHHFACPDRNFGISHKWIDVVVGTLRKRDPRGA